MYAPRKPTAATVANTPRTPRRRDQRTGWGAGTRRARCDELVDDTRPTDVEVGVGMISLPWLTVL
jgi:hypothetical protein